MRHVSVLRIQNSDITVAGLLDLMERIAATGREVYIDGDTCSLMAKEVEA